MCPLAEREEERRGQPEAPRAAGGAAAALETPRLRLRPLVEADAPFILQLLTDPSFLTFIGDRGVRTTADARAYIVDGPMASYAANGYGLYLVARRADGAPMGMCGLVKRPSLPTTDLGYAFLPPFWGKGYATEAGTAVLADAYQTHQLSRVLAITALDNTRSIRVLERLGFQFEKLLRLSEDSAEVRLFAVDLPRG